MKVSDCKKLVQHLILSSKEKRFSEKEIKQLFPEIVSLSREKNKNGLSLFRSITVPENKDVYPFELECTSKKNVILFRYFR